MVQYIGLYKKCPDGTHSTGIASRADRAKQSTPRRYCCRESSLSSVRSEDG